MLYIIERNANMLGPANLHLVRSGVQSTCNVAEPLGSWFKNVKITFAAQPSRPTRRCSEMRDTSCWLACSAADYLAQWKAREKFPCGIVFFGNLRMGGPGAEPQIALSLDAAGEAHPV